MKLRAYFQGILTELRKVQWPTVPVMFQHFFSVIIGVALATVIIWGMDFLFLRALSFIIS